MKITRKLTSVLIVVMLLVSCFYASFTVDASTGTLCSKYATNPGNKVGVQKTITIDGSFSDWSEDMLIAQGTAWDVANHYKGGHENCVLDTYSLYGAWDNNNLYIAWQMVNTTDTWARSGDGPLSDGGRVLDVPLIIALSVDPSSVSMSNKNTNGRPIWGQKMGLTFEQHVDRLLYMSGKPGLGEPAMFTAVDADGNTNYTDGCKIFRSNGIEYKMAEGNICSSITGLNYSEDPNDVYNEDADWVDYKTFKGSSGTHDTKYDSFYEIKIPLATLGVDADYIKNYGIGAMVVATRGESGLDCIPFDDTMLDNATGSYSNDPSTSKEKDDVDVITSEFARIGNLSGSVVPQPTTKATQPTTAAPQPTTAAPQPTTAAPQPTTAALQPSTAAPQPTTVAPVTDKLTVNAKSNLFGTGTSEFDSSAETVTVTYDLQSSMKLVNGQWKLSYDSSKLRLKSASNTIMPNITTSAVINTDNDGLIRGNFSDVSEFYDFTVSKPFVQVTFDKIGTGSTDVVLDVQELSVGYKSNNKTVYKNAVVNSVKQDLSSVAGFTSSSISGSAKVTSGQLPTTQPTTQPVTQPTTVPVENTLTVNAVSNNTFGTASKVYTESDKTVTVEFKLKSAMEIVDGEWTLSYDNTKLRYNSSLNPQGVMPNVKGAIVNTDLNGLIKGDYSSLSLYDFTTEKDYVKVTFEKIGTGTTTVNFDLKILGVAYLDDNFNAVIKYPVDFGVVKDITGVAGFEKSSLNGRITFGDSGDILMGDVNLDGVVDITDATCIQKHCAQSEILSAKAQLAADLDGDGFITVNDATELQRLLVR